MSGSWVSGEAPARSDNRTEFAGDGPQASLDRAVGTNQEIEPGEPNNRSEASVPGLADWLLGVVAGLPTARGLARSSSGASVVDA